MTAKHKLSDIEIYLAEHSVLEFDSQWGLEGYPVLSEGSFPFGSFGYFYTSDLVQMMNHFCSLEFCYFLKCTQSQTDGSFFSLIPEQLGEC